MPTTHSADNLTTLHAALEMAQAGDRIELKPGFYGVLDLYAPRDPFIVKTSAVTIASQNPTSPAQFSGIKITGAHHLRFENLVFDYATQHGPRHDKPFLFKDSHGLSLDGVVVQGANPNIGQGLSFRNCADIHISNRTITGFYRGIVVSTSDNVTLANNLLTGLGSDGINIAGVHGVAITDNALRDFAPHPGDDSHRDFIQFWTAGGAGASSDILITNNKMFGQDIQGIFMRSETMDEAGNSLRYNDVNISGNFVMTDVSHGIRTAPTDGLTITNNTVLPFSLPGVSREHTPVIFINESSTEVTASHNVGMGILKQGLAMTGDQISNNLVVQDLSPGEPLYLSNHAVTIAPNALNSSYLLDPLSILPTMGAGLSHVDPQTDAARIKVIGDGYGSVSLDARSSSYGGAFIDPETARFEWALMDGQRLDGPQVSLSLPAGTQQIGLSISENQTSLLDHIFTLDTKSPTVLDIHVMDADIGMTGTINGSQYTISAPIVVVDGDPRLALSAGSSTNLDPGSIFDMRDFRIAFDFALTDPTVPGHIMRVHDDWLIYVTDTGALEFWFWASNGSKYVLQTQGVDLRDGVPRHIEILRAFEPGKGIMLIDGAVADVQIIPGYAGPKGSHDLVIGDIFGWKSANGWLDNLRIDRAIPPFFKEYKVPHQTVATTSEVPKEDVFLLTSPASMGVWDLLLP
jgi:hypothetical protein